MNVCGTSMLRNTTQKLLAGTSADFESKGTPDEPKSLTVRVTVGKR